MLELLLSQICAKVASDLICSHLPVGAVHVSLFLIMAIVAVGGGGPADHAARHPVFVADCFQCRCERFLPKWRPMLSVENP